MLLSILIPTLPSRKAFLAELLGNLEQQLNTLGIRESVQIIEDSRTNITTGEKRNSLLSNSSGKYVWFVDDDDEIMPAAFANLLPAMLKGPDVIGINGYMTTDGAARVDWEIRLGHPYKAIKKHDKEYYLRHPNHITPMLREHAIRVKFEHVSQMEDYKWAVALRDLGLLQTQEVVEEPVYHYKYRTKK